MMWVEQTSTNCEIDREIVTIYPFALQTVSVRQKTPVCLFHDSIPLFVFGIAHAVFHVWTRILEMVRFIFGHSEQ